MKKYRYLSNRYFTMGNVYREDYDPDGFGLPISKYVERFPDEWELVEDQTEKILSTIKSQLDDIDTKINNLIQLLKCN